MKKKVKDTVGWREWVSLPDIGVKYVKAKVDTGAQTSSLHAFDIRYFTRMNKKYVRFKIHPVQRSSEITIESSARLKEIRKIRSSNGHISERPVIETTIRIFDQEWPMELTLSNRDEMGFRMLIGRQTMRGRLIVDPGKSYFGEIPEFARRKKKKTTTKSKVKTKGRSR